MKGLPPLAPAHAGEVDGLLCGRRPDVVGEDGVELGLVLQSGDRRRPGGDLRRDGLFPCGEIGRAHV